MSNLKVPASGQAGQGSKPFANRGQIISFALYDLKNPDAANVLRIPSVWYPPDHLLSYRRDKFTLHSKAIICQDVELKGDITIGSGMPNFRVTSFCF